jgi:hypothetical protein
MPSPTDKNIKLPQPNIKSVPFTDSNCHKKKYTLDGEAPIDGTQEDYQNYRRMKVTTSAWGKRDESSPKPKNGETLNIIYDSTTDIHQKQLENSYLDDEDLRTSSPEHLGIPAGPVRMPLQRKTSIKNTNSNIDTASTNVKEESFNNEIQKRERNVKKQEGKNSLLQESTFQDTKSNAYTSDDSCVDSFPPSRVRHPPNRRKITKSSSNGNNSTNGDGK